MAVTSQQSAQSTPLRPAASAASDERQAAARLVLVVTFLLIFIMAARTPLDTDMWWHLRAGEETLRTGRILHVDIFSFTRAGAPWVNVYWLADAGMALLFRLGSYLALSLAVALLAVLSMLLVYLQCEGPVFFKAAALLFGSMIASVVWSPRPQILSLVYLALIGVLLYRYKWQSKDHLWVMPLVFIVWANTHGGYPLGLILIGGMLAGETLNHLLGIRSARVLSWPALVRLGLWGVACGFAVLLNPNGLELWKLPFTTVNMQVLQQFIPEWASPDFHQLLEQSVLWLLLGVFACVALSGRLMDGTDLVVTIGFAAMALLAKRNFGPFAIVGIPILTRYASAAFQAWRQRSPWLDRRLLKVSEKEPDPPRLKGIKKGINLGLAALLMLAALGKLYIVTYPALVAKFEAEAYPAQATAWLAQHPSGSRVLNEYNWGGYLQWKLNGMQLFVDGRTDLFGDQVIGDWITAVQAGEGWQEILSRYQVDEVMLQPDRPLAQQLGAAGWNLLYQDARAVIYGKK